VQAVTFEERARVKSDLSELAIERLGLLVREWSLLADLGFCDLVLFVRSWNDAGWYAITNVRPSTVPTLLLEDPVGFHIPRSRVPEFERAWRSAKPIQAESRAGVDASSSDLLSAPTLVTPVPLAGRPVGLMAGYSSVHRPRLGELESEYLRVNSVLLGMVAVGKFPSEVSERIGAASPRVGDGMVILNPGGKVRFASPNARMALRALGVSDQIIGASLADEVRKLGSRRVDVDRRALAIARGSRAGESEISATSATVTLRAIPLDAPEDAGGAVLLVRDVTEVRRQERALLSKDASISEIHHRVKNNLQTVGALLRMQARRLPDGQGRSALQAAMARVDTIAVVHDALSRSPGDDANFDEVCQQIVAMASDSAAAHQSPTPRISVEGVFGQLPTAVATPLAMVINEILHNAVEHSQANRITLGVNRRPAGFEHGLQVSVHDNGIGFDPTIGGGLGLQIVRTLASEQLGGTLVVDSQSSLGTTVLLECPLT
jgi:two-component sensor histidine kinase